MHRKFNLQMNLFITMLRYQVAIEHRHVSQIFDATPKVIEMAYKDLVSSAGPTTRREGMTA
jgi:hypothetical protein